MSKGNIIIIIKNIIILYLIFLLITGVLIFLIKPRDIHKNLNINNFYGREIGNDRVVLVEDRYFSYLTRMDLIENANNTIDIAYHTINDGETTRAFFGSLINKADEGVKVRFLIDGVFHSMKRELKDLQYTLENHPNIELKFYETIKPLKPWTLNNRLHDKVIIIDGNRYLSGGRNLGDRYFLEDYPKRLQVRDRDVFVYRKDNNLNSSVDEFIDYFEKLWNSEYSVKPGKRMNEKKINKANVMKDKLLHSYKIESEENRDLSEKIDYEEMSFATNKISIVSNPINRLNKYPLVFETLVKLFSNADKIEGQSPYVIPSKWMRDYLKEYNVDLSNINLITNSEYSSPNLFGISGYVGKYRKKIVDNLNAVYEYQERDSIHGKSYIMDKRLSAVGSFNFDNRSAYLSTETMILIDSEEFSKHLLKEFDTIKGQSLKVDNDYKYIEDSRETKKASFIKRILIRILSIFSYFFDFML